MIQPEAKRRGDYTKLSVQSLWSEGVSNPPPKGLPSFSLEAGLRFHRERYASLSRRERQMLALVVQGLLNKLIAASLSFA